MPELWWGEVGKSREVRGHLATERGSVSMADSSDGWGHLCMELLFTVILHQAWPCSYTPQEVYTLRPADFMGALLGEPSPP